MFAFRGGDWAVKKANDEKSGVRKWLAQVDSVSCVLFLGADKPACCQARLRCLAKARARSQQVQAGSDIFELVLYWLVDRS